MPSADSIAGIRAVTSAIVCPRARRRRARQPHRSTVADITCDPGRPIALEISGHAASVRATRTFARRRRCAHHGTARMSAPHAEDLRNRRRERAEQARDRQPRACRERRRARVDPFGEPGQVEPRAERDQRPRGHGRTGQKIRPPVRVRGVEPPARPEHRARGEDGRELGAVLPRPAGEDHHGGRGELAIGVDDHDRLQAAAADAARVPAHLPVAGHARRLVVAGVPGESSSARR